MTARTITNEQQLHIQQLIAAGNNYTEIERATGLAVNTVRKYVERFKRAQTGPPAEKRPPTITQAGRSTPPPIPDPDPIAGGPTLPDAVFLSYDPFRIDNDGHGLILGDIHLPYHDTRTIQVAVDKAKQRGVSWILLNGDILDCYEMSVHDKNPNTGKFVDEVEKGRQFLAYLRSQFPRARIVYKEGNHEFRLRRYVAKNAPALFDLKMLEFPALLEMQQHGVEWVADKRVIQVGKLNVVHGHEFRGGGGVNPARWLFLRSVSTALCGHFHRTSEHHETALDRRLYGVWSVGCACYLYPQYDPQNKWNHGFAFVELERAAGMFHVTNHRLEPDGRLL